MHGFYIKIVHLYRNANTFSRFTCSKNELSNQDWIFLGTCRKTDGLDKFSPVGQLRAFIENFSKDYKFVSSQYYVNYNFIAKVYFCPPFYFSNTCIHDVYK